MSASDNAHAPSPQIDPSDALKALLAQDHPAQKSFGFKREAWLRWLGHLSGLGSTLTEIPARLDRPTVRELVQQRLSDDLPSAFVVAMIWGHGSTGYGPYRAARILTASKEPLTAELSAPVVGRLKDSVRIARSEGAVPAYRFLNTQAGKICNLGPAFFTKWLYFVTADDSVDGGPQAAPILDVLVQRWLRTEAGLRVRAGWTVDYQSYLDLLTNWGKPYGIHPAGVEERIFRLIRDDGAAAQT